jgi:hypothetical protein
MLPRNDRPPHFRMLPAALCVVALDLHAAAFHQQRCNLALGWLVAGQVRRLDDGVVPRRQWRPKAHMMPVGDRS